MKPWQLRVVFVCVVGGAFVDLGLNFGFWKSTFLLAGGSIAAWAFMAVLEYDAKRRL